METSVAEIKQSDTWTDMTASTPAPQPEYVVCIDNVGYPVSLELHKIYRILPDPHAADSGDLRVVDESGKDYL